MAPGARSIAEALTRLAHVMWSAPQMAMPPRGTRHRRDLCSN
jgi:hypothetical protein